MKPIYFKHLIVATSLTLFFTSCGGSSSGSTNTAAVDALEELAPEDIVGRTVNANGTIDIIFQESPVILSTEATIIFAEETAEYSASNSASDPATPFISINLPDTEPIAFAYTYTVESDNTALVTLEQTDQATLRLTFTTPTSGTFTTVENVTEIIPLNGVEITSELTGDFTISE